MIYYIVLIGIFLTIIFLWKKITTKGFFFNTYPLWNIFFYIYNDNF